MSEDTKKEKRYKLVEMYTSTKGEGTQSGMPMLFVRFSKCNLACTWCDTPYNRVAMELRASELIAAIIEKDPTWVVFTGGEPCLQLDTAITEPLMAANISMAVETNGMIWTPALAHMDYVNISPKLGQPVHDKVTRAGRLGTVDEVRFTICDGQTDLWNVRSGQTILPELVLDAEKARGSYERTEILIGIKTKWITISPGMKDLRPREDQKSGEGFQSVLGEIDRPSLDRCLYLVHKYRRFNARLSLQTHKFIGAR